MYSNMLDVYNSNKLNDISSHVTCKDYSNINVDASKRNTVYIHTKLKGSELDRYIRRFKSMFPFDVLKVIDNSKLRSGKNLVYNNGGIVKGK